MLLSGARKGRGNPLLWTSPATGLPQPPHQRLSSRGCDAPQPTPNAPAGSRPESRVQGECRFSETPLQYSAVARSGAPASAAKDLRLTAARGVASAAQLVTFPAPLSGKASEKKLASTEQTGGASLRNAGSPEAAVISRRRGGGELLAGLRGGAVRSS